MDGLATIIINQCNAFLDAPVPDQPCGYYLQTLLKYADGFYRTVGENNEQLHTRFQNRLHEVLNKCYIRGELDFDYNYCFEQSGAQLCRHIGGSVPFSVKVTMEPHGQISGHGTLDWNGWMTGQPEDCTYNETGTVNVTLTGELVFDNVGSPVFEFTIVENAFATLTAVCENLTIVEPIYPGEVTHNIRMMAEDGTEYSMPVPGVNGSFRWVLHLIVTVP